jgi:uncharacterized protein (TIGR03032 family)
MAVGDGQLALVTRHDIVLFADAPVLAADAIDNEPGRYDGLYLPRVTYHTGDIHAHDLAFGTDGLWICNTRYSCLAHLSDRHNFLPRWQPPFISDLCPEDRCHLNGLAMLQGKPKFVTALGRSDYVGGWRSAKATGGVVLDVESGEPVLTGLCMPHSPRVYDGTLWLLNSGRGEFLCADVSKGTTTPVCRLPGYLRGLSFLGPYAIIGLSRIRERHLFGGLPIQESSEPLLCSVAVIDLRTGEVVGMFHFTDGVNELYDVVFMPQVRRPMLLSASMPMARDAFTTPQVAYWLRPSKLIEDATEMP